MSAGELYVSLPEEGPASAIVSLINFLVSVDKEISNFTRASEDRDYNSTDDKA